MAKDLIMTFLNEVGNKTSLKVRNVREDLTEVEVANVMDTILVKNIFQTNGGELRSKETAKIVETNTVELMVK